jgi:hypothetical protein
VKKVRKVCCVVQFIYLFIYLLSRLIHHWLSAVDEETKAELGIKTLCEEVAAAFEYITFIEGASISSNQELISQFEKAHEEVSDPDAKDKVAKALIALKALKKGAATNVLFELEKVTDSKSF